MELYHKEQFGDAKDVLIPGTKVRCSRTEENEQVINWMKQTGRIPLYYTRESNGLHAECSAVFEAKIKDAFQRGNAVGNDGRKYTFENADNLFPICGSICVRATAEGGRSDSYGLDFFV